MTPFAVLALGVSFMTSDYGEYLTDDVARKMHGRMVGASRMSGRGKEAVVVEVKNLV